MMMHRLSLVLLPLLAALRLVLCDDDYIMDYAWGLLESMKYCDGLYRPPLRDCTRSEECQDCLFEGAPRNTDGYITCSGLSDYFCTTVVEEESCPCLKGCEQEAKDLLSCYADEVWSCFTYFKCEIPVAEPTTDDAVSPTDDSTADASNGGTDGTTESIEQSNTNTSDGVHLHVSRLIMIAVVFAVLVTEA